MKNLFFLGFFLVVLSSNKLHGQNSCLSNNLYLAQTPPGMVPEKFAPGIISTDQTHEGCSGFLDNGNIFVYQCYKIGDFTTNAIYEMRLENGEWSAPEKLEFSVEFKIGDFTIAPDGKTMFFASKLPIPEIKETQEGGNIYKVIRDKNGWGKPGHLGLEVNTKYHDSYACADKNGKLYFFSRRPGGYGMSDLYTAELVNGKYTNIKNMGAMLNSEAHEWDSCIAPDNSYIIFCSTKDSKNGYDDLYISFKKNKGQWSEPVNMGSDFNTEKSENRPYITQDGKYLFYASTKGGNRNIYWVDAKVIDKYR